MAVNIIKIPQEIIVNKDPDSLPLLDNYLYKTDDILIEISHLCLFYNLPARINSITVQKPYNVLIFHENSYIKYKNDNIKLTFNSFAVSSVLLNDINKLKIIVIGNCLYKNINNKWRLIS